MSADRPVVWILGAGFSRSLGAPLLNQLFTRESFDRVLAAWNEDALGGAAVVSRARQILRLYQSGVHGFDHIKPHARLWEHAEEFLERLDRAKVDPIEHEVLKRFAAMLSNAPDWPRDGVANVFDDDTQLSTSELVALRLLAAECSVFLESANVESERWSPYVNWAMSLGNADTVLTFNYDCVIELLSERMMRVKHTALSIPIPKDVTVPVAGPRVLKLHGSVSWNLTNQGMEEGARLAAVHCQHRSRLGMATPGQTKRRMIDGTIAIQGGAKVEHPLRPLWAAARTAIREAKTIVFVGYRIPSSDAYTRGWMIDALRSNKQIEAEGRLLVHTVLGDDINHKDSRRLAGLLREVDAQRRIQVEPWPMFAEDFLDVATRDRLLREAGTTS